MVNKIVLGISTVLLAMATPASPSTASTGFRGLDVPFIANGGQVGNEVLFYARSSKGAVSVTREGTIHLTAGSKVMKESFAGGKAADIRGEDRAGTTVNFLMGRNPEGWRTNLPSFNVVSLGEVYEGITVKLKYRAGKVEKFFYVEPGADPRRIALKVQSSGAMKVAGDGGLEIAAGRERVRLSPPVAFQRIDGERKPVPVAYALEGDTYGFTVGSYDRKRELVIDPVIEYSTLLSGSSYDVGKAIAVDTEGNSYVVGSTGSADFLLKDAMDNTFSGTGDGFVLKISADSKLVYATFLGGTGWLDNPLDVAVDSNGCAYVVGETNSDDFPLYKPLRSTFGWPTEVFVLKLNPSGSGFVYSTYLGGSSGDGGGMGYTGAGIAVDARGKVFVTSTTRSNDFPLVNPLDATFEGTDSFVTVINPKGDAILYSTFLGGSGNDNATDIALDDEGNIYIVGSTRSEDFPLVNPIDSELSTPNGEVFVSKISADGSTLLFSTYFGGSGYAIAYGVAVDGGGDIVVVGATSSTDFPLVNPVDGDVKYIDAFITKINTDVPDFVYSTYLGGRRNDYGYDVDLDGAGNAYIVGMTQYNDFPLLDPVDSTFVEPDITEGFITKFSPVGAILYSTFLGGSGAEEILGVAVDYAGAAYVTGDADRSFDFPLHNPIQDTALGHRDAFAAKISGAEMVVDVKGNKSDSPLTIDASQKLELTVELQSLGALGAEAEYWLAASTTLAPPMDWLSYDFTLNRWVKGLKPSYAGPAYDIAPLTILSRRLPAGFFQIYFMVDMNINGKPNVGISPYDVLPITVLPSGKSAPHGLEGGAFE